MPSSFKITAALTEAERYRRGAGAQPLIEPQPAPPARRGVVAVAPAYQNRGYGTALLRRRHADLDTATIPAYVVAISADARRHYLRHGYGDDGEPITLHDGIRLQPMWRYPATETNA